MARGGSAPRVLVAEGVDPRLVETLPDVRAGIRLRAGDLPIRGRPGRRSGSRRRRRSRRRSAPQRARDPRAGLRALLGREEGGARAIQVFDPLSLGVLAPPGELGADIAVAEGQSLGNHLAFGGPYLGLIAARMSDVRRMPGRIVGETVDVDGTPGYVLTLQAREQHIRREKANSNICTNQTLMAVAATIYLGWLGPEGLVEVGRRCAAKAAYAADRLTEIEGVSLLHPPRLSSRSSRSGSRSPRTASSPLSWSAGSSRASPCGERGRRPARGRHGTAEQRADRRLRRRAGGGARVNAVGAPIRAGPGGDGTILDRSVPGAAPGSLPPLDVPETPVPHEHARRSRPGLPEVGEVDLVRHYTGLAQMNYGLDTGMYPLGSCTMKYNPKVAETVAALPGFQRLHPLQPDSTTQGVLELPVAPGAGSRRDHGDGRGDAAAAGGRVRRDDRSPPDARVPRGIAATRGVA